MVNLRSGQTELNESLPSQSIFGLKFGRFIICFFSSRELVQPRPCESEKEEGLEGRTRRWGGGGKDTLADFDNTIPCLGSHMSTRLFDEGSGVVGHAVLEGNGGSHMKSVPLWRGGVFFSLSCHGAYRACCRLK